MGVHNAPERHFGMLDQLKFMSRRMDISLAGMQFYGMPRTFSVCPAYTGRIDIEVGIFRNINYIRIFFIHRIIFRLDVHLIFNQLHSLFESIFLIEFGREYIAIHFIDHVVPWKSNCPARVLFFGQSQQVCRIAQLCFDFLFGISKIIIRDQGNDHAFFIAACNFKC